MSQNDSRIIVIHEPFSANNIHFNILNPNHVRADIISRADIVLVREKTNDLRYVYRFAKNRYGGLQGIRTWLNEYESFRQLFELCPTIDLYENIDGVYLAISSDLDLIITKIIL